MIEAWRPPDKLVRPHSSFGYRLPAPEDVPWLLAPAPLSGAPAAIRGMVPSPKTRVTFQLGSSTAGASAPIAV